MEKTPLHKKVLRWVFDRYISPGIILVVAAIWGAVRVGAGKTAFDVAVGAAQFGVSVLLGWAAFHWLWERRKRSRLANPTPEENQRRVEEWMLRFQFAVTRESKSEGLSWRVMVERKETIKLTIMQEEGAPWVTVSALVQLGPRYDAMYDADPGRFRRQFSLHLLPIDVEWLIEDEKTPRGILMYRQVVFDESLHPLEFLRALSVVDRSLKFGINVLSVLVEEWEAAGRPAAAPATGGTLAGNSASSSPTQLPTSTPDAPAPTASPRSS